MLVAPLREGPPPPPQGSYRWVCFLYHTSVLVKLSLAPVADPLSQRQKLLLEARPVLGATDHMTLGKWLPSLSLLLFMKCTLTASCGPS